MSTMNSLTQVARNLLTEVSRGNPHLFFIYIFLFQPRLIRSHEETNLGLLGVTQVL
jgi:hypothetical protein